MFEFVTNPFAPEYVAESCPLPKLSAENFIYQSGCNLMPMKARLADWVLPVSKC